MHRSASGVARLLLTSLIVSMALSVCPCGPASASMMDDCCLQGETSIAAACCEEAPPAKPTLTGATSFALASPDLIAPVALLGGTSPASRVVFEAPSVSPATPRTILRI